MFPDRAPLIGTRLSCLLGACGVVALSRWLGAEWLGDSFIGVPVGAWLVGAATGVSHLLSAHRLTSSAPSGSWSTMDEDPIDAAPTISRRAEPVSARAREISERWNEVKEASKSREQALFDRFKDVQNEVSGTTLSGPRAPEGRVEMGALGGLGGPVFTSITGTGWSDASPTPTSTLASNVAAPGDQKSETSGRPAPEPEAVTGFVSGAGGVDDDSDEPREPTAGIAEAWSNGIQRLGRRFFYPGQHVAHGTRGVNRGGADRGPGPVRIRIGVWASAHETATLIDLASSEPVAGARVEWVTMQRGADPAALRLDAMVRRERGDELTIRTNEVAGYAAAWGNWGRRMPLSYAGVFPTRVDTGAMRCGVLDLMSERDARLVARLAEAGGLLARTTPRLPERVVDGRWAVEERGGGAIERTMLRLSNALAADWTRHPARTVLAARAGARAAGAWLASWDDMDAKERRRLAEACAEILADEPESVLRVAAARLGAYEDQAGMDALAKGFKMMVARQEPIAADPLAFIHAEIEFGSSSVLTLGRAAAGLCLLWATSNQQSLDYLRDDLLEDLRYASRFIGQDQDHVLLREVIRHMDQLRCEYLPMAGVAA